MRFVEANRVFLNTSVKNEFCRSELCVFEC